MTLKKVVVDLRSNFWEHGQLYVAISRVCDPHDLYILLPKINDEKTKESEDFIKPVADMEIVQMVQEIENKSQVDQTKAAVQEREIVNENQETDIRKEVHTPISKEAIDYVPMLNIQTLLNKSNSFDDMRRILHEKLDDIFDEDIQKESDYKFSIRRNDLVGLENYGKTCYINSFLQILYHIGFLKNLLLKSISNDYEDSLRELFCSMDIILTQSKQHKIAEPISIIELFNINIRNPGDVNEFVILLMNKLTTNIQSMFTIISREETTRIVNDTKETTIETDTHDLCLYLNSESNRTLYQEIKSIFEKKEIINNDQVIYKQKIIEKWPPILMISINRTFYQNGILRKNNKIKILIQKYLNVNGITYRLFGSIIHHGNLDTGHYSSFIDCGEFWANFSDNIVTEVKEYRVIKISNGVNKSSSTFVVYVKVR